MFEDSYFAFHFKDAVAVGGCTSCQIGCCKAVLPMWYFELNALMNKPLFENLKTKKFSNDSRLSSEVLALEDTLEAGDGREYRTDVGSVGDATRTARSDVAADTIADWSSDWILDVHSRLFKFPTAKGMVADFTIFPDKPIADPTSRTATSNLPSVPRTIPVTTEGYNEVLQLLFHEYYGGCRIREVNTIGVYVENTVQ
ncbi:hypothetical protein L914_14801 [Phytophthora nicotianae]|uniref:Uncharacterized protein n=1 Tax=Phytophthora nicotianae TaxID=4792 RepID=W2MTM3_PHYNI|nr:hypothetical protein L914_14801 [Phytophthora nicotianae]